MGISQFISRLRNENEQTQGYVQNVARSILHKSLRKQVNNESCVKLYAQSPSSSRPARIAKPCSKDTIPNQIEKRLLLDSEKSVWPHHVYLKEEII